MPLTASRAMDITEIPVIDISALGHPDAEAPVLAQMAAASRAVGFFYISGHGIPAAATADIFTQTRRFFALPQPARDAIRLTNSPLYRGYLPPGLRGDQVRATDILESFNVGRELGPEAPEVQAGLKLHGANQWPEGLPGFRAAVLEYYQTMDGLMHRLLGAMSLLIGEPRQWLSDRFMRPLTQMRLLHYWPQPIEVADKIGARPHQDTTIITILAQDGSGGLEVQLPDGEWVAAPPRPDMFVVNIGELLEWVTAGAFRAAMHRVVNRSGQDRYSVPFFCTPDYQATLAPLPQFLPQGADIPPGFVVGEKIAAFYRSLWPSAGQG